MSELAQVQASLNEVLRRLDLITATQQPDLTITEFARQAGYHPNTIHRWIKDRRILTRHGRIPVSELKKFIS